ncbi:MAG TPA: isoprenylcysteine carboxylmethyltransferase family protein [Bacteroidales bacterium]|nr:MAG: NnrU protein [Deltaproteobacteria bacterium ADurb.Bin072]HOH81224.1 isoprenylcysteine carboxylmethyltransferase family protein [Methanoregulaceae archaeon]HPA69700.1 isoprenylcysteine carboxylmethyltransferase family protein [Bacteroidales bacterium]HPO41039.1 isoprenylcysteine carboxylmethyltransferase family protein [Bacteroidales bacterium]HQM56841.1 isoprenylcysteine carboxylmethyltransferase family protein [Methanoregulaceae archaeon]
MKRTALYILIYSTLTFGLGSMLVLALFLFVGSFTVMRLDLTTGQALLLDACLSVFFFSQHSILIRRSVREQLVRFIPDEYYSAFYALVSGIALTVVLLLWQKIPGPLVWADGIAYWLLHVLFFVYMAGFHWVAKSLGSFDALGIKQIQRRLRNKETRDMPMTVKGAYRWVRHPLYSISLLMIWSCPVLTADRLLFNVLWTTWIVIATMLEERDLVYKFGDQYRAYQRQVPMIIPYRIPRQSLREA